MAIKCILLHLVLTWSLLAPTCALRTGNGINVRANKRLMGKGGKGGGCSKQTDLDNTGSSCNEHDIQEIYYQEHLVHGESTTLLKTGPLLVQARCQTTGVGLVLRLDWQDDLFLFGDWSLDKNRNDLPHLVLQTGNLLDKTMWFVGANDEGNDVGDGAVWLSTGHYVAWGGDQTIGIHRSDKTELKLASDNVNCIVTGTIHYVLPEEFEQE